MNTKLKNLHRKYIHLTNKLSKVAKRNTFLGEVPKLKGLKSKRVYISTWCLKHLYDKRTAVEYEYIVEYLSMVLKFPDNIYTNLPNRQGDLVLHRRLKDGDYIAIVETAKKSGNTNHVLTSFRIKKKDMKRFNKV